MPSPAPGELKRVSSSKRASISAAESQERLQRIEQATKNAVSKTEHRLNEFAAVVDAATVQGEEQQVHTKPWYILDPRARIIRIDDCSGSSRDL